MPHLTLVPVRDWAPYRMSKGYENTNCCKLNSERTLCGPLADTYGYAAIKDIVEYERRYAEATFLDKQIQEMRKRWKHVFVPEMCELLREQ
jgi:hypothetical protein